MWTVIHDTFIMLNGVARRLNQWIVMYQQMIKAVLPVDHRILFFQIDDSYVKTEYHWNKSSTFLTLSALCLNDFYILCQAVCLFLIVYRSVVTFTHQVLMLSNFHYMCWTHDYFLRHNETSSDRSRTVTTRLTSQDKILLPIGQRRQSAAHSCQSNTPSAPQFTVRMNMDEYGRSL